MEHILSCKQFSRKSLEELLDLAKDIKLNPKKYENALENKIIAPIFFEPSTRTRLSFETAALKLGAKNITTENAQNSSTKKGETLQDTISVLSGYADCIVMRHSQDDAAEIAASVSKVPILNAGSGKKDHPSQSLLDIFTIREKRGTIDGIKIAILGDLVHGRTIHSLLEILTLYKNIEVFGLSKTCFRLPEKYKELLSNVISKNIELQNDYLRSEIDAVVFTKKGAFIIEVKNTKKNIFIDKNGLFFRVTDERQQFDSNIAEKMQTKEALLRTELDKLGYSGLQIFKIVVFTNTKAEIQNKCKQLKTCFSSQLATIIENWDAPVYLRTNDLYTMSEAINRISSSATFPMEFDTDAAKKNFALLVAKLELAELPKKQTCISWIKNLAAIFSTKNHRYATATAAAAVGIITTSI